MIKHAIPYGRQYITDEDIQEVVKVLKSDYLTQGPKIAEFEKAFAEYIGSKYAVAVANGTAALHLNTLALGVKPGDKVITTPISFAATANCVKYCGGEVVFADINPSTYLLDINKVRKLLEQDSKKEIVGIIPVDFAGRAVDMKAFRQLADEFGCWLLEDACHAPGGYFANHKNEQVKCGNSSYADASIFSFHPVKHIAAGEGGMITTNSESLYNKLLSLRTHGIVKNEELYENSIELAGGDKAYPGWYMEMQTLGFNYRLTDFQAALGLSQLKRAEEGLKRRRDIADIYYNAFKDKKNIKGQSGVVEGHAYHLYILEVEDRLGLYNHLKVHNIFAQIHYVPTHLMPYYKQFGYKEGDFPHAENYYKRCISLPMFPTLNEEEQKFVITKVIEHLENDK